MTGPGRDARAGARAGPLPEGVRREVPLERLATVRTGGSAELFARVEDAGRLHELLAWAAEEGIAVNVVGSGSNLLIADAGVDGLTLKLAGALTEVEVAAPRILCGGGARLPSVAATAAREGLAGIEFGVNIPGTVGGAVRMNANAYGGELERALEWVEIASAGGVARREPSELGLTYRNSALRDGEIVARAGLLLEPRPPHEVKAALAELRRLRHEAQPQGIRTFGSTFKNPDDPRAEGRSAGLLLAEVGANGLAVGGARFAPKHANFIENTGTATTAEIVELMARGRDLVRERFGVDLEPEVQTLGDVRFPW